MRMYFIKRYTLDFDDLFQFSYAIGFIFFLELVGGILAFVFSSEVQGMVTNLLQDEGLERYREKADLRDLFDWFQEEVRMLAFILFHYE